MAIATTDQHALDGHHAALLQPGSLIYLWRPGDQPWIDRHILARVERATQSTIIAEDLVAQARCYYEVDSSYGPARRYTWEFAAPPPARCPGGEVERIDGAKLTLEERIRLVCGEVGASVTVRLRSGDTVTGVLSKLIMGRDPEAWEPEWAVFTGPADSRGQIRHVLRVEEIAGFSRSER